MFIVLGSTDIALGHGPHSENYAYKPLTDEWIELGSFATIRHQGSAIVHNNQILVGDRQKSIQLLLKNSLSITK